MADRSCASTEFRTSARPGAASEPLVPARRTVAGETGNLGERGSPWASRSTPALRVGWAVRGGLCAPFLGAPVFRGVRPYFSKTSRVYQSSVTFYLIVFPPHPLRATGRSLLVRGGGCVFWGVGASHIIRPGSGGGLFVPWPGELGVGVQIMERLGRLVHLEQKG